MNATGVREMRMAEVTMRPRGFFAFAAGTGEAQVGRR